MPPRPLRLAALALGSLAAFAAAAPAASAADLIDTGVSADGSEFRRCHDRLAPGAAGVVTRRVQADTAGLVWARLSGDSSSDWDLAVFDADTRRAVAGSAGPHSNELAEGFTSGGGDLIVQACRLSGDSPARLAVSLFPQTVGEAGEKLQLVRVSTPTRAHKTRLSGLGLDLTEHGGADFVEVVLHGARDVAALQTAGLRFSVEIPDLVARSRANQRANAQYEAETERSGLPSKRTSYRRLPDYELDLKRLAFTNPGLVKLITLPHRSLEGRDIVGVEITTDVGREDGKPVFLNMGVHHAREWPSAEHAMEWAIEAVTAFKEARRADGSPTAFQQRLAGLVGKVRTIVVPTVNPDGFNLSREAPIDLRPAGEVHPLGHTAAILGDPGFAYKRRNCRVQDGARPAPGECGQRQNRNLGVDPNRNYGGFWGGPGASSSPTNDTYWGALPFSEPETQNIRELVSTRQVTTLITNHTYSNLVLRPPGLQSQGPPPDEPIYKALGDAMAEQNGYVSQRSYELYDTTGTTEDWTYTATGGLGFTFEIGPEEFHPPFEEVVREYTGGDGPFAGRGNRLAYLIATDAAADTAKHAVITGRAKPGSVVRLRKEFLTTTSSSGTPGSDPILFEDRLDTQARVPDSGEVEIHANPSTRPAVAGREYVKLAEEPYASDEYANTVDVTVPGGGSRDRAHAVEREFTITQQEIDEGLAGVAVHLRGGDADDYDLYVFRELEDGRRLPVASAADGDANERAVFEAPVAGKYVYQVVNWLAVEQTWTVSTERFKAGEVIQETGQVEAWTLTCERPGGEVLSTHKVIAGRGDRVAVDGLCEEQPPASARPGSSGSGKSGAQASAPGRSR